MSARACLILLCAALLGASRARAGAAVDDVPQVGRHYKILTVEKSVHPQNALAVYTRLDADCRVVTDPKQAGLPAFDFYWLMDHAKYKRVHPLIKRGIRKRLQVEAAEKGSDAAFTVRLNELDAVVNDLGAPRLKVRAEKSADGKCSVEGRLTLGPSDSGAVIRLDSIYSDADVSGFSAKVHSITLKGADAKTGKAVTRTYRAKD